MRALLFAAALTSTSAGATASELVLRANFAQHGPVLRLADVLDEPSRARLAASRTSALGQVALLTLGLDAVPFTLRSGDIADRMSRAVAGGLGPWTLASGQVAVNPQTVAMSAAQRAALLGAVESTWQRHCVLGGGVDCSATARLADGSLPQVPVGNLDFVVRMPVRPLDESVEIEAAVAVRVDGVAVGRLPVQLVWTAQRDAFQLKQSVAAGEALRSADLMRVRTSAHGVERDAVAHDVTVGVVRATRALTAGALLPTVDPAFIALYRRGDAVPVRLDIGHVSVVRQGIAAEDAATGRAAFIRLGDTPTRVRVPAVASKERVRP